MRRLPFALAVMLLLAWLGGSARADIPGVVYNSATGHWYKHYTTTTTWSAAKSSAEAVGGYLVVLTSLAENDWVKQNVATTGTPWLGGTDEVTEGSWAWVDNETWSYTNWGPGEPNNSSNEDYLQFRTDGMWNDVPGGNSYTYVVEWNSDPNGPPEVPTNLTANAADDSRVNLAWTDPSTRETGFEIERSESGGAFGSLASTVADVRSFPDTNVVAETSYSYRVRSVGSGGSSAWSNIASVTTPPPPAIGLTATLISSTRVRVDWSAVAASATGVEIERGKGSPGSGFGVIGTTSGTETTFTDSTAAPETTFAYRVRVVGPGGKSRYSAEAYVTTPPASPSDLVLTAPSDTRVVLGWRDNSALEIAHEIERGIGASPASFAWIATLAENVRAYTDDSAEPETTYTYRVRALNASGGSDWSASGRITTPPRTPAGAAAVPLSATRMRVTWSDVSTREIGFLIQRAVGMEGAFEHLASAGYGAQEHVDATARQEILYRYRVAAYSLDGSSNWTESVPVAMPAILVVSKVTVPVPTAALRKKAAPRVLVSGEFDIGGRGVDLLQAATLEIGGTSFVFPAAVARGRALRAEAAGARLDLKPAGTTSRVPFQFRAPAGSITGIDADGELTIRLSIGAFHAVGAVRLEGGAFETSVRGSLADPACELLSLVASAPPNGGSSFTLKAAFDASSGFPDELPQIVVRCGGATFAADPSRFVRSGNRLVLKQKVDGGTRAVTLDYARGLATIIVRGGIEIGSLAKGSTPLAIDLTLGDVAYADTLTVKSTGRAARY